MHIKVEDMTQFDILGSVPSISSEVLAYTYDETVAVSNVPISAFTGVLIWLSLRMDSLKFESNYV